MPPWIKHFLTKAVVEVFEAHGIYVVEDYGDGQVMWGTERPRTNGGQYTGKFFPAGEYVPGAVDIFTIRRVITMLGKENEREVIEAELEPRLNEGLE